MPNQNKNKKKNKEPTDEELLAEIEKEAHDEILNETVEQNINVDDLLNNENNIDIENNANNANNINYDDSAQLTTFQDNIITTGSDAVRKTYNYFTLQSKIKKIANPLDAAKPISAEDLTPINLAYDHKSYAVYNAAFVDRDLYLQKQKEGAPSSELKDILLKRAVKCIERYSAIQRDGVGIRKNWNMDLLPKHVWTDFIAAQRSIQCEIESVTKENTKYEFDWGEQLKHDIFGKAKEVYGRKMDIQRKVFHHKQRLIYRQKQQRSSSNTPNPKTSGSGFKEKNKQQTPAMMQNNVGNNNNLYQTQAHRRKKGKLRFSIKGK